MPRYVPVEPQSDHGPSALTGWIAVEGLRVLVDHDDLVVGCKQVDAERQDHGVEQEGDDAVDERQAAHDAAGDLHVRDLAGHADDE